MNPTLVVKTLLVNEIFTTEARKQLRTLLESCSNCMTSHIHFFFLSSAETLSGEPAAVKTKALLTV